LVKSTCKVVVVDAVKYLAVEGSSCKWMVPRGPPVLVDLSNVAASYHATRSAAGAACVLLLIDKQVVVQASCRSFVSLVAWQYYC
jgi:hypothetical protein